jgi:hypothetical protein
MRLQLFGLLLVLSRSVTAQFIDSDLVDRSRVVTTPLIPAAQATNTSLRPSVVKINPISLLAGQVSAFYERALTDSLSIVIGYGMGSNLWNFGTRLPPGGCTYQRVTLETRYYWKGKALTGFYAGPYLRVARLTESYFLVASPGKAIGMSAGPAETATHQALIWMPGGLIGHQIQNKRFTLDSFVGLQFQFVSGTLNRSNQVVEAMSSPFVARVGISLGFAL